VPAQAAPFDNPLPCRTSLVHCFLFRIAIPILSDLLPSCIMTPPFSPTRCLVVPIFPPSPSVLCLTSFDLSYAPSLIAMFAYFSTLPPSIIASTPPTFPHLFQRPRPFLCELRIQMYPLSIKHALFPALVLLTLLVPSVNTPCFLSEVPPELLSHPCRLAVVQRTFHLIPPTYHPIHRTLSCSPSPPDTLLHSGSSPSPWAEGCSGLIFRPPSLP